MAVGRVAVLYYRQIRIAQARTCIAKLANWPMGSRHRPLQAIADKLSPLMQICSPVVKYNYNSYGNLLSLTSSKV